MGQMEIRIILNRAEAATPAASRRLPDPRHCHSRSQDEEIRFTGWLEFARERCMRLTGGPGAGSVPVPNPRAARCSGTLLAE